MYDPLVVTFPRKAGNLPRAKGCKVFAGAVGLKRRESYDDDKELTTGRKGNPQLYVLGKSENTVRIAYTSLVFTLPKQC